MYHLQVENGLVASRLTTYFERHPSVVVILTTDARGCCVRFLINRKFRIAEGSRIVCRCSLRIARRYKVHKLKPFDGWNLQRPGYSQSITPCFDHIVEKLLQ